MYLFVVNAQAIDNDFAAKARDFDEVLEGGLVMGISECVIRGCRGVPFGRKN